MEQQALVSILIPCYNAINTIDDTIQSALNQTYETLEIIKKNEGLENLPIIIFTGKSLSKGEETRSKQYADSIVVKTAHSYQRILDEAGLFLHLVEEKEKKDKEARITEAEVELERAKKAEADALETAKKAKTSITQNQLC